MKHLLLSLCVLVAFSACKKQEAASPSTGSAAGSAAPIEDVRCKDAAPAYTKKMAALPGNVLSDAKPDDGLIYYAGISMEVYCEGDEGLVGWTAEEKACVVKADTPNSCFHGSSLGQVETGLDEVVKTALENKRKNAAEEGSGSGS